MLSALSEEEGGPIRKKSIKLRRNALSQIPKAPCPVDSCRDLPFMPTKPLPPKSFAMYIVGAPGSGKTNLWLSMLLSKKPVYYREFFDRTILVTGSLQTLPKKIRNPRQGLPPEQIYSTLEDDDVHEIISKFMNKRKKNTNNLLILDDVVKAMTRSRALSKVFLNRRHVTQDSTLEGHGGLAIMTMSQKYNLLPLEFRTAMSHVIVFKTDNNAELKAIKEELLGDLDKDQQTDLLKAAWTEKYSFLTVVMGVPRKDRYFIRFDPVDDI